MCTDTVPGTYLEFRIWKQGRVNIENLSQKLKTATSQATWDIIMEHYLLQAPFCVEDTLDLKTKHLSLNKLTDPEAVTKIGNDTFMELENNILLDLSLTNQNIELDNDDYMSENLPEVLNSVSRKRKHTMPSIQRVMIGEDNDSKEIPAAKQSDIVLDSLEQGDQGVLSDIYSKTLPVWLEFGFTLATPAIKKHTIVLTNRHLTNVTIKELQSIILNLSRENAKAFRSLPSCDQQTVYIPYAPSNSIQKCLLISRNFEQWKASTVFNGSLDFPDLYVVNTMKHMQKFCPSVSATNAFIPRQKILWALVESDRVSRRRCALFFVTLYLCFRLFYTRIIGRRTMWINF